MPPSMTTEARIRAILVEHLGIDEDEIEGTSHLEDDLGADSLDRVELTMAVEDQFDLEIPDEDADDLQTVQQVVAYVDRRTSKTS
jgi:acyl carrier protein